MKAFVPIEKQSKKARREYHKKQRRTWGAISPVTRKSPDPQVYKTKKSNDEDFFARKKRIHNGEADEPTLVDFFIAAIHNGLHFVRIDSFYFHCVLACFIVYFSSLYKHYMGAHWFRRGC